VNHPDELLDRRFMAEALDFAARIPRRPWPNPPVGALVVRDGVVVGRGAHHGAGTDHAEAVALREAGGLSRGATLYCTLEPCNHHGRTPPCAPAVAAAGIGRVVAAMRDPNPRVHGGGLLCLEATGVRVDVGLLAGEALDLVWPFVATRAFERPFVILKTAASIDGCLAPAPAQRVPGEPFYLTGVESRSDVHRLRRWCDVVLVGERTMAEDRPQLDGRLAGENAACPAADPVPAFVDTDGGLDAGWPRPYWVFTGRPQAPTGANQAPGTTSCEARAAREQYRAVVPCDERDGRVEIESLVAGFAARGGHVLMVEGGPSLATAFLRAGLVDRWVSYTAPLVIGDGIRWGTGLPEIGFHLTRVARSANDVKAVWDRLPFQATLQAVANPQGAA
jgi:diaminohydroxyphosphoribosylaminopyrimidine deaminase / 5-amino-6-(5-phosphoribosylamino)uracil reductase